MIFHDLFHMQNYTMDFKKINRIRDHSTKFLFNIYFIEFFKAITIFPQKQNVMSMFPRNIEF